MFSLSSVQLLLVWPCRSFVAALTQAPMREAITQRREGQSSRQQMTGTQTPKIPCHGLSPLFSTRNPKPAVKISRIPSNREGCDNSGDARSCLTRRTMAGSEYTLAVSIDAVVTRSCVDQVNHDSGRQNKLMNKWRNECRCGEGPGAAKLISH